MPVRSRKKYSRSAAARKSAPNTDSSGSESSPHTYEPIQYVYDEVNRNVVTWGYILLFISWLIFVGGVGGVLGVWDRVLGFSDNRIMDLSCYFSLIVVTGFVWTVLNWVGLKSFRMTSSKCFVIASARYLGALTVFLQFDLLAQKTSKWPISFNIAIDKMRMSILPLLCALYHIEGASSRLGDLSSSSNGQPHEQSIQLHSLIETEQFIQLHALVENDGRSRIRFRKRSPNPQLAQQIINIPGFVQTGPRISPSAAVGTLTADQTTAQNKAQVEQSVRDVVRAQTNVVQRELRGFLNADLLAR